MLPDIRDEKQLHAAFRWNIPERYNIGVAVCDLWAEREPQRLALLNVQDAGIVQPVTYGELRTQSNRLANLLVSSGITRGERVAILLPQSREVAESHIAIYKMAGIALPLAVLFGTDALAYRLDDAMSLIHI